MAYLTDQQLHEMADAIYQADMVQPLSHHDKIRVAYEHALDEYGVKPRKSACLLAMNFAKMRYNEAVVNTKQSLN